MASSVKSDSKVITGTIFLILFSLSFNYSFAQDTTLMSIAAKNNFLITVNRNVNTYLFVGRLNLDQDLFFGRISLNQNYNGTAIKTINQVFRDEEIFGFNYLLPLSDKINLIIDQNWQYISDTRSTGINKLERLNGLGGLKYDIFDKSYIKFSAGLERSNLIGLVFNGPIVLFDALIKDYNIEDYKFNIKSDGEYVKQDGNKTNSDFNLKTGINKSYDLYNNISFDIEYKMMNRDLLSQLNIQKYGGSNFEERKENRIKADLTTNFSIFDLLGKVNLSINNGNIEKSFKNKIPSDSINTSVKKKLNEFQINALIEGTLSIKNFNQVVGLNFYIRNESNNLTKKFALSEIDFLTKKIIESQKDLNANKVLFYSKSDLILTKSDNINMIYNVSLLQYDTPSIDNNDDRDEFQSIVRVAYQHKFSTSLSAEILGDFQMKHLVYLKSTRSSMNNWERIIRFSPIIKILTNSFSMSPQFEVMANYTIYDFEEISPGTKSFSFRQVSYKDSIHLDLGRSYSFQSNISIRYFERGILFWNSFSESPQNENSEIFIKVMLKKSFSNEVFLGTGLRYFSIKQVSKSVSGGSPGNNTQHSIGPEMKLNSKISKNSTISFEGWYEFQYINKNLNVIPNFFILTSYKF